MVQGSGQVYRTISLKYVFVKIASVIDGYAPKVRHVIISDENRRNFDNSPMDISVRLIAKMALEMDAVTAPPAGLHGVGSMCFRIRQT